MKSTIKLILGLLVGIGIGIFILLLILFFANGCSFEACAAILGKIKIGQFSLSILLAFVTITISLFLQIILHETGHLIFGLLTGYKFVSFRIGKYTLIKVNGKFKIKHFPIAGTGGQCLLTLPESQTEAIPYFWYNIGGSLINFIISLITLVVWLSVPNLSLFLDVFLIIFSGVGIAIALFNTIPMKAGGVGNDGYNIMEMVKHPDSRLHFINQLRINAANQEGKRLIEMPKSWFMDNEEINFGNAIEVSNYNIYASRFIDSKTYDKAYTLFKKAHEHRSEIIGLFQKEIDCELLFLELIGENQHMRVNQLYSDDLKAYINAYAPSMSSKKRLQFALALYYENDDKKARNIYDELKAKQDAYLLKGEIKSDLDIMQDVISKSSNN